MFNGIINYRGLINYNFLKFTLLAGVKKRLAQKNKKKMTFWGPTLVVILASFGAWCVWPQEVALFFNPGHFWRKVVWPLTRAMGFMTVGLAVAMVIETLGWTVKLGRLASPLTRLARLPVVAAASFTAALVSKPASNALLSEALEEQVISPRALVVANLLNGSWPSFVVHLPTTLVMATSLAGSVGLAYTGIMFAAATLRLVGAAFLGKLILPPQPASPAAPEATPKKSRVEVLSGFRRRLSRRLVTVLSVAAPVYYLITLAAVLGFFDTLRAFSAAHLPDFFLPVEAATLIIFSLTAEFSSGFMAAGALMQNATLTWPQAVAALIVGNIIATPLRVIRWQLSSILGFFNLRQGLILIFFNQTFRVLSMALTLFVFWRLWG